MRNEGLSDLNNRSEQSKIKIELFGDSKFESDITITKEGKTLAMPCSSNRCEVKLGKIAAESEIQINTFRFKMIKTAYVSRFVILSLTSIADIFMIK